MTCIDSRIDPLAVFGLEPGDAKILRNAGARVTDDVERGLALAAAALGVTRIAVVQHTDCKLTAAERRRARRRGRRRPPGRPPDGFEPLAIADQPAALAADVEPAARQPAAARRGRWSPGSCTTCARGRLSTVVEPVRHRLSALRRRPRRRRWG